MHGMIRFKRQKANNLFNGLPKWKQSILNEMAFYEFEKPVKERKTPLMLINIIEKMEL